jgi:hypothetical protein
MLFHHNCGNAPQSVCQLLLAILPPSVQKLNLPRRTASAGSFESRALIGAMI